MTKCFILYLNNRNSSINCNADMAKPNSKYEYMVLTTSLDRNVRLNVTLRLIFGFLLFTDLKFLKETNPCYR